MKQFLQGVTGVEGYLIFSMILFLVFFLGLIVWVYKADKKYITECKNIPFQQTTHNSTTNTSQP
jgi:cytochrome c oxidase cbb3-type subunit 4